MQTREKLESAQLEGKATLILDSHECCDIYIREPLDLGIFNFGYLPHGDPEIMTRRKIGDRPATEKKVKHCWHGVLRCKAAASACAELRCIISRIVPIYW